MLLTFLAAVIYGAFIGSIHERGCLFWLMGKVSYVPVGNAECRWDGFLKGARWLSGASFYKFVIKASEN